ncbi:MAG: hypothetical protein ACRC8Y_13245 [Chroococcales cyanobacterium]
MKHDQLIGYYTRSRTMGYGCRGDRVEVSVGNAIAFRGGCLGLSLRKSGS